ncbi:MAG: DEAD/DEAH box helicase [Gammaproteobacteria bacterium]|jgi:ATP-dependent RNA helicase RhlB|nr:DEAD/DEAH box helicase [Gammaproteobacteria bacterium]MBT4492820.1 DEAD/DEAH box helicase [Gammaproteobacteria bacterium]MBT7369020.1 DEAD/DEAH box helicase [Gammaproteobacteria bacterium]
MKSQIELPEDFARLDLPDPLARAIKDLGFESCTPVQNEVLPHSLNGRDIIAQAQTGTGKTAAFLVSIISYDLENPKLDERPQGTPFALIIAPTRELVLQITADAEQLVQYTDISIASLVGGMDYDKQRNQLGKSIDIVVATPGRLLDFARSGVIDLSQVEIMIIDEADRMLSMGFIPDVKSIVSRTPKKQQRQTQLFSATYSEDIKRLAASWTLDPVRIEIEPEQIAVDTVDQRVFLTSEDEKYAVLYNLIQVYELDRVLVFANRRDQCRDLESQLNRHGFKTGLLAGDVPQKKRIRTLEDFRSGKIAVLVATDVAGRGLHIDDISHVINYNLPEDPEDYVHRIGRTGRAGSEGVSITLACESDAFMLPNIEALLGAKLDCEHPEEELLAPIPQLPPAPRSHRPPPRKRRRR